MGLRQVLVGFVIGFLVVSCAGLSFGYKFYGLQVAHYDDGTLLGPKAADNLPFTVCEPTAADKAPCIVMLSAEFNRLKADYMDTKQKLNECQTPK